MQKYFLSKDDFNNLKISSDDVFHIKNVMRFRTGDNILVGYDAKTYLAKILNIDKEVSFEIIEEVIGNHELPVFVSIFQGYPKSDKLEEVIKHSTELGAYEIIPLMMKRSIVKIDEKKKESKLIRFNKIAKEAAEQSYRDYVPMVLDIKTLKQVDFSKFDVKLLCNEETSKSGDLVNLKRELKKVKENMKIAVVIGPEGGVDKDEISYLEDKGFISVSLGKRILRTETVVFSILSMIGYELELKQ